MVSAGIGVVSPFLLRAVLDTAIPQKDTQLLTLLVLGMIAVSVSSGAIGVAQTWLSNSIGQRVMHDLRSAVYAHLQRMSLAFFTRTHTGEVQSRIANDIGGIDNVVTSTATSIMSNVTTVLATLVAMIALELACWRCSRSRCLPFFLWLTRRVGQERKRITSVRQSRLADMSTLVEESLSVSGILLGKTMGRGPELARRFSAESAELADIEVRSRMAGRWRMASVQMSFAIMPALVYWFAGDQHRPRRHRDLDRHGGGVHHPADAPAVPDAVAAIGRDSTCRPRSRCSRASSSTSTCAVDIEEREHAGGAARRARRRGVRGRVVPLRRGSAVDARRP